MRLYRRRRVNRIRDLRLQRGLTQSQLAQRVKVEPGQVSRWEREMAVPSVKHQRRLAKALLDDPDATARLEIKARE